MLWSTFRQVNATVCNFKPTTVNPYRKPAAGPLFHAANQMWVPHHFPLRKGWEFCCDHDTSFPFLQIQQSARKINLHCHRHSPRQASMLKLRFSAACGCVSTPCPRHRDLFYVCRLPPSAAIFNELMIVSSFVSKILSLSTCGSIFCRQFLRKLLILKDQTRSVPAGPTTWRLGITFGGSQLGPRTSACDSGLTAWDSPLLLKW
jgi:hypothetical protein